MADPLVPVRVSEPCIQRGRHEQAYKRIRLYTLRAPVK